MPPRKPGYGALPIAACRLLRADLVRQARAGAVRSGRSPEAAEPSPARTPRAEVALLRAERREEQERDARQEQEIYQETSDHVEDQSGDGNGLGKGKADNVPLHDGSRGEEPSTGKPDRGSAWRKSRCLSRLEAEASMSRETGRVKTAELPSDGPAKREIDDGRGDDDPWGAGPAGRRKSFGRPRGMHDVYPPEDSGGSA